MRSLVKLTLFFCICFALIIIGAGGVRFLLLRLESLRTMPVQPEYVLPEIIAALRWALSLAVYGGVLLGLSYAARKHVFALAAVLCIAVLTLGFAAAVSIGLQRLETAVPSPVSVRPLGGPGLILANAPGPNETSIILLAGPAEGGGPRVAAVPGRPLVYQAEPMGPGGETAAAPALPFPNETPWFLTSLAIDIRLNAEQMRLRFNEGLPVFLTYTGALIFFLCSLDFILKLSGWPLANLFLGALAFRGALALETLCNSPEMRDTFDTFVRGRFPPGLTVPLLFGGAGLFLFLYSMLAYSIQRQHGDEP